MSEKRPQRSRVAFVRGDERYSNVRKALDLLGDSSRIKEAQRIVVKPNMTLGSRPLSATHVDAVRAVLDYLRQYTSHTITIAEGAGTGSPDTMLSFSNLGYRSLRRNSDIRLVDLNADRWVETEILDSEFKPFKVRVARTIVEADYRISVTPPKTHDCVVVTAALKNLIMGSVLRRESRLVAELFHAVVYLGGLVRRRLRALRRKAAPTAIEGAPPPSHLRERILAWAAKASGNDKLRVHQGFPVMNLNLYRLARFISPHLAVIDGFQAMGGPGPTDGYAVPMRLAIASTDSVAADSLAAVLMGFDPAQIGYLAYCVRNGVGVGDVSKMDIVGDDWRDSVRQLEPHPEYYSQINWQIPDVEKYLA